MPDDHPLSIESVLTVLADRRCRSILSVLIASPDNTVSLPDLAESIATAHPPASDHVSDIAHITSEVVHIGLPQLEGADIVEYDRRTKTVRYHPQPTLELLHQALTTELTGDVRTDTTGVR